MTQENATTALPRAIGPGSAAEVTDISPHGLWLLAGGEELFLACDAFPWFRHVRGSAARRVEEPGPGHFRWPDLDVDLTRDSILHPARQPLVSGQGAGAVHEPGT